VLTATRTELNVIVNITVTASFAINKADLTVPMSHAGSFMQGQTGATYTITAANSGTGPTAGTVTVTDILPSGLAATAMTGSGWSCSVRNLTCSRSNAQPAGTNYPPITLTVTVATSAPATLTNIVTVSGGGEANTANNSASDLTTITPIIPDLKVALRHTGDFKQGQTSATYSLNVSNIGNGPTTGTVTVVDTLPGGLSAKAISGSGWACTLGTLTCTRSTALAAGASYPSITITVAVASDAPPSVANVATVSGGGEVNTANDTASRSYDHYPRDPRSDRYLHSYWQFLPGTNWGHVHPYGNQQRQRPNCRHCDGDRQFADGSDRHSHKWHRLVLHIGNPYLHS
jgi:uncharacterized repeat protein (TIGR01451 family)